MPGPAPVPASISDNYATLIPDLFDASTWNLDAFSPLAKDWAQDFGGFLRKPFPGTRSLPTCRTTGRSTTA